MISWLIIIGLVIAAVFALKMNHLRHRVWIILIIMLALFLYATMALVYRQNEIKLNTAEDFIHASRIYLGWLGHSFDNLKLLTGNAVRMDWTSANSTLLSKNPEQNKKISSAQNKTSLQSKTSVKKSK
jgi:hypothetical protein